VRVSWKDPAPPRRYNRAVNKVIRAGRLAVKTLVVFAMLQTTLVALPPSLRGANAFSLLEIKRERLPLSTVSPIDNALDVGSLDAMFASHVISNPKAPDEFRVLVLGDSTIWGLQLGQDDVLPGRLNQLDLACDGREFRFYNLSFPRSSATKDILILDRALETEPDAILWLVTWYTLSPKTRVDHWLITQNPAAYQRLATRFDFLPRDYKRPTWTEMAYAVDRALFRAVRYQLYALVHVATKQDQIPGPPQVPATDLSPDPTFEGLKPPTLRRQQVSIDQVEDLHDLAKGIPVLLVNEPILIMRGVANSDVRYNSYYPRWVYDQYRAHLSEAAVANGWDYMDLWDLFPEGAFADTPLHLKPGAHRALAEYLAPRIRAMCPQQATH
jgi:hypothetical protein